MKTKNEKYSKLYFILKQKWNVPFDPRIMDRGRILFQFLNKNPCTESAIKFSF